VRISKDDEALLEIAQSWRMVMSGLKEFENLQIPRLKPPTNKINLAEFHVFGDSFESANRAIA
jgi:hypothetical protein